MKSRPVVVDASAALSLLLPQDDSLELVALLERLRIDGATFFVPELLWLEVTNSLLRRHHWTGAEAIEAVHRLEQIGLGTIETNRGTRLIALGLAERFGLTVYDAIYLALAETMDARLVTLDGALSTAAGSRAMRVAGAVSEEPAPYERAATWASWKGLSGYLASLRAEVAPSATSTRPRTRSGSRPRSRSRAQQAQRRQ